MFQFLISCKEPYQRIAQKEIRPKKGGVEENNSLATLPWKEKAWLKVQYASVVQAFNLNCRNNRAKCYYSEDALLKYFLKRYLILNYEKTAIEQYIRIKIAE